MSKDHEGTEEGRQVDIYGKRFVGRKKSANVRALGRKSVPGRFEERLGRSMVVRHEVKK